MSNALSIIISGWDQAISESQRMLDKVTAKAERLKANIQVLKEAKENGEPWPTQSASRSSEPCQTI